MSSPEHPAVTPSRQPLDVVFSLAEEFEARHVATHGRFSLARPKVVDEVFILPDGSHRRLLVAKEDEHQRQRYSKLEAAGISQLEREVLNDDLTIYGVPLNAKLLSNERLFAERTSSETYVSDRELFMTAGKMWAGIWRATGEVAEKPLGSTLMSEFGAQESLLPVPPYRDWELVADEDEAQLALAKNVVAELHEAASDKENFQLLTRAFIEGWRGGERIS